MDLEIIQRLVASRRYQVKLHAVQHALKEGFSEREMVEAVLSGQIIETYPDRQRVLVCGQAELDQYTSIYLHVVCEQTYPDQIEIVTAYIPDEKEWKKPTFTERRRDR